MTWAPFVIARLAVLRMLRERSNLFFVLAFPLLLVLLIGLSFGGGSTLRVVVVAPDVATTDQFVEALEADDVVTVTRMPFRETALDAVARGRGQALVVLPEGLAEAMSEGRRLAVEVAVRDEAAALHQVIARALADLERIPRIERAATALGASPEAVGAVASPDSATVEVTTSLVGEEDQTFAGLSQFDLGASSQLVLFVFLTTLGGATRIVEGIELGTTRRVLSGPVAASTHIAGEGLGRFSVALFQAAWIVLGSTVLFGVDWGDPLAGVVVVAAFAAASAGAGLLLGALATTSSQANGLATVVGLVLAALGGSMAPLDIFGPTLRRVAHVTPHAWANDAFATLTRRGGGVGDVLTEVGVLLAFAAALGGSAALVLRRRITGS